MEIVLHSKGEDYTVLIDEEDYEKVSNYKWHINHQKYKKYCQTDIYINGKHAGLKLHRFLLGLENGDKRIINHIDGNSLNNQKSNLEMCNNMYNSQSINTKKNFGTICIKNDGRKKKYCPEVRINKKRYRNSFFTKEEAQAWLDGLYEIAKIETVPFQ